MSVTLDDPMPFLAWIESHPADAFVGFKMEYTNPLARFLQAQGVRAAWVDAAFYLVRDENGKDGFAPLPEWAVRFLRIIICLSPLETWRCTAKNASIALRAILAGPPAWQIEAETEAKP